MDRRTMLQALGSSVVAANMPRLAWGNNQIAARFVLVILRGAVDGLAMAPPYGDGHYQRSRGLLALSEPGGSDSVQKLDGLFGLHPSLKAVHKYFGRNEATLVHAVASPYRQRSHFDGQDLLENGGPQTGRLRDGWLNRSLAASQRSASGETAIALMQNTPLVLRGSQSVASWAPSRLKATSDDTIDRLQKLYASDAFFATRLNQALNTQAIAAGDTSMNTQRRRQNETRQFVDMMQAAAKFLAAPEGPSVAVVELDGWDTHANQGAATGSLSNRLAALDDGINALGTALGDRWSDTIVGVVTEFGRTVEPNGTRGTDHGTATAALLVGGAVNGGRVIADWPGLESRQRFEGRDLMPTTDLRSVFKGILIDHLQISPTVVERDVFPDSGLAKPLEKLVMS